MRLSRRMPELHGENGSFLLVALVLPVLMLLASFAIDIAGIYVHRRHLQIQADAAALAGASKLQVVGCDNSVVTGAADRYVGLTSSEYNRPKIAEEAERISRTFAYPPCSPPAGEKRAVDVTVTETDAPLHFPFAGTDADISARARVELLQIAGGSGALPIALEEDKIKSVSVTLFDETLTPETDPLAQTRTLGMAPGSDNGTTVAWSNGSEPFTRDVTEANLGMRVTVVRATGTSTYDLASQDGILHIHGFEQVAPVQTESPPALERVELTPGPGCAADNGYFVQPGCKVHVRAQVDFVDAIVDFAKDATVNARLGTSNAALVRGTDGWWEGDVTAPSVGGPVSLNMDWVQRIGKVDATTECGNNTGAVKIPPCAGVFRGTQAMGIYNPPGTTTPAAATQVHRTFVASEERTHDIAFAKVTESSAVANSVERCGGAVTTCAHSFQVYIGLPSPLQLGSHRILTVAAPGSNDGHLNCDPEAGTGAQAFEDMLAFGCKPFYVINEGEPCPDAKDFGPGLPQPWSCVPSSQGDMTGKLGPGMDRRVYGSTSPTLATCVQHRNRWPNWEPGETRIVLVMLVRPPELDNQGVSVFPVKDFAYFYITGWSHAGLNKQACPLTDSLNEPMTSRNAIAGYFIKYVVPADGQTIGEGDCSDDAIGGCVPVMTE